MIVGYIAKHDSGGNDDEGAVTHALEALGHRVERLREINGRKAYRLECDFVLCHKWSDLTAMRQLTVPLVVWYFDLVSYPDPSLEGRNKAREQWMCEVTQLAKLVFATDGDHVARDTTGKLVWLPQGTDGRVLGPGDPTRYPPVDLLFAGSAAGGSGRASWVAEMKERYGPRFRHVSPGRDGEGGAYGRDLADHVASAKIVLAPDHPVTDRYWSNRVYNVIGFGGFLLHPYAEGLRDHYGERELVLYRDREHLHWLINRFLGLAASPQVIAEAGYERTRREHTYLHRVETLVRTVKERLGL